MKISAGTKKWVQRTTDRHLTKNLIETPLVFKDVFKAYTEIEHAPPSHGHSEVDLDDYGEFDALDEIIMGMWLPIT